MIHAIIVDDDATFLKRFAAIVQKISVEQELSFCLETSTEPLKLLEIKEDYDLYFFDILMPGITGIELANKLRKKYNEKEFIFVSNNEQYIRASMAVKPCGFVRKRYLEEDLRETFLCLDRLFAAKRMEAILKNNTKSYPVRPQDIMYINSKEHYLCLIYKDGTNMWIRDKMKAVAGLLGKFGFLRVNNSCLINLAYVEHLCGRSVILKDGYNAKITDTYWKDATVVLHNLRIENDRISEKKHML